MPLFKRIYSSKHWLIIAIFSFKVLCACAPCCLSAAAGGGWWQWGRVRPKAQLCADDGGRPGHWRCGLLRQQHYQASSSKCAYFPAPLTSNLLLSWMCNCSISVAFIILTTSALGCHFISLVFLQDAQYRQTCGRGYKVDSTHCCCSPLHAKPHRFRDRTLRAPFRWD